MSTPEGSSILFRRPAADVRPRALRAYVERLRREVAKGGPFECLITGDAELRRLNREFRGKDEPTDVLSFPSASTAGSPAAAWRPAPLQTLGSLAISLAQARSQARSLGHSIETEIRILILHGLLHLLGYDHEADSGRMARAEKRWREILHLPNGLIERGHS